MKDGQGAEDDILGAQVQPGDQLMAIRQDVRVCGHDAFRCAFGTGGEQDYRGLIGVFIRLREIRACLRFFQPAIRIRRS